MSIGPIYYQPPSDQISLDQIIISLSSKCFEKYNQIPLSCHLNELQIQDLELPQDEPLKIAGLEIIPDQYMLLNHFMMIIEDPRDG